MIDPLKLEAGKLDGLPHALDPSAYDDQEPMLIESVHLGPVDLERLRGIPFVLDGCVVVGCDLSMAQVRGVKHSRVESSKLRGTTFANYVKNVAFAQSRLVECGFRMMLLKHVAFSNCELTNCDFYGSELTELSFDGSSFEGVGFDACTIDELDLTGASSLLVGDPRTLAGASLCETQIPAIAQRLAVLSGIKVDDC